MEEKKQVKKVYKIQNYCGACLRRNCKYIFGSFYINAKINSEERVFDIWLHKSLPVRQHDGSIKQVSIHEHIDIERFKKFWGAQWRIILMNSEDVSTIK